MAIEPMRGSAAPVSVHGSRRRWRRRFVTLVASVLAVTVPVSVTAEVPALAAPSWPGVSGPAPKSVPVGSVKAKAPARSQTDGAGVTSLGHTAFPAGGAGDSAVSGAATAVGGLPVTLDAEAASGNDALRGQSLSAAEAKRPSSVRVQVADQKVAAAVGVHGVVLGLSRSDGVASSGRARLQVDYSGFANAYGANYGSRLRLVALPGCALVTPQQPACQRQTSLPSVNRETTKTVSADVPVAGDTMAAPTASPMVFAVTSAGSSANGDYTATSLSPDYAWVAGNQGGSFANSYPLTVPASLGGPAPQLSLGYDSGAVDGKTSVQNGQTSWVGEGWNLEPGYIERSYRPCAQDGNATGDLCWFSSYNATMVFNGRSTRLIRDNGSGVWHASDDSGLRVEQLFGGSGTSGDNGTYNKEYWRVTTLDGTQYYFGVSKRYAGDGASTGSALSEPVFGNNPGEPCYSASGFGSSACWQGYRWNLDYVVDPRGNSMTYFYTKLAGAYGAQNNQIAVLYDMSATLDHIDYGTRAGSEYAGSAPMRVSFTATNRCINACGQNTTDYPDTPWDQYCAAGASTCPNTTSMVYFTRSKLSTVTSQVWNGSGYRNVDKWDLTHTYPASGDWISPAGNDTSPNLWLQTITHTGYAADGTTGLAAPTTTFGGTAMVNRKNWGNDLAVAPYVHYRLTSVRSGSGRETDVTYSGGGTPFSSQDCVRGWDPQPAANPSRCFPVYFKPVGSPPGWDWFHKYIVTGVTERDLTGGSPDETWSYNYSTAGSSDAALWHHDYNETSQLQYRSWTQWQGYSTVAVTHGPAGGPQTVSTTLHHRGMDGDGLATTDNQAMVWNARRTGLVTPLGTPGATGSISGVGGRCLDITGGGIGNGTPVQLWDCSANPFQIWRYNWVDQSIRNPNTGRCLDVSNSGTANGTQVQIWDCNLGPAQVWQRTPDGALRNPNSGKCLDIDSSTNANGRSVRIWDCNASLGQVWQPQADGTLLNAQATRCVDVNLGGPADGTKIQSWQCNHGTAQAWQWQANGSLKDPASGKCMDVTTSGTANGTLIQLYTCNGTGAQVWQPQADGSLRNPQSGRCLDVPAGNGSFGVQLQIYDCNGGTGQQWRNNFNDADGTQGFTRDQQTLDGGQISTSTIHEPTVTQTAVRATPNAGGQDLSAYMVTDTATRTRTWLAGSSSWRWTETDTSYDSHGLPTDVKDLGDIALGTDDRCTHTDYARNDAAGLFNYPSQVITTNCAVTPGDGDHLVGAQTFYDNSTTLGAAPSKGLATRTTALASVASGVKTWKQAERGDYDTYGRVVASYDALDHKTGTAFTPAAGGPVTATTVTNAMGWTTTTTVDPGKGVPTSVVDINGKTTTVQYDSLGRLTRAWLNNRPTSAIPDRQYTYTLSDTAPNAVQTQTLGPAGQQITSYTIYDGRLRPRQTQTPAPQAVGGRVIADTAYDNRGLAAKTSMFWNNTSGPTSTLASFTDASVLNQHRYSHDNLQRQTVDALYSANALKWETTTGYDGDRATVTPPTGGIATTVISNAHGKTTTLRQYLGSIPSGAYQDTTYTYDRLDRQTGLTDPAGNTWTTSFDLRGRTTQTTDPDKGTLTSTYDDAAQLLTTTDARGTTLSYTYDNLGRKTEEWKDAVGTGTKLATWTYDTLDSGTVVKGQPATSTRYVSGNAYTNLVTGYDDAYRPLGATVRIPAAETGLAGDWTTSTAYNVDGSPASTTYPAGGGLAAETVTTRYDNTGHPLGLTGLDTYVADTQYYYWGGIKQRLLGAAPKQVRLDRVAEEATGRLTQLSTSTQTGTSSWAEQLTENYNYNPAGQVTSIAETHAGATVSNQCFNYDGLQQLTEAWTTTATTCQTTPTQPVVGGPDPYWSSYRYDSVGNRTSDVSHDPAGDTTRTYTYPAPRAAQPHGVTKVTATGATASTNTYSYDTSGNTKTRNIAAKPGQTLTWDDEGHLASVADSAATASYLYDAAGSRLIGRDSTGTTLYLGIAEIHRDTAGTVTTTRFYADSAVRTSTGGLTWLAADHHATGQLAINAVDLSTVRRKTDPFGNPRGTQPAWPTTHGYVNGITDPTGLTHLGAREYDPGIGRFISVDPIQDLTDPQQWNGYTYSNSNPVTSSDPTGLIPEDCNHFECYGYSPAAGTSNGGGCPYGCGSTSNVNWGRNNGMSSWSHNNGRPSGGHPGGGGGSHSGSGGHGGSGGHAGPSDADIQRAKAIKKQSPITIIAKAGGQLLLDLFGVTDILKCIGGDALSCVFALAGMLPIGKALTWAKNAPRIAGLIEKTVRAFNRFTVESKWAEKIFGLAESCAVPHSFAPGTKVVMADGGRKPIEQLKEGDKVVATDPGTGTTQTRQVTATHTNHDTDLTDITVTPDHGQPTLIKTTQHHPLWSQTRHEWIYAADLHNGETLRTLDGTTLTVTAVTSYTGAKVMHDLTIDTIHTYYVIAGNTPVLVHNCGDGVKIPIEELQGPPPARGRPPVGNDGHPVELHHRNQTPDGPLDEMTRTDHRLGDNYSNNHSNTGGDPSQIDRGAWDRERKTYWRGEWDSGRFDGM